MLTAAVEELDAIIDECWKRRAQKKNDFLDDNTKLKPLEENHKQNRNLWSISVIAEPPILIIFMGLVKDGRC